MTRTTETYTIAWAEQTCLLAVVPDRLGMPEVERLVRAEAAHIGPEWGPGEVWEACKVENGLILTDNEDDGKVLWVSDGNLKDESGRHYRFAVSP